jgi:hypothetical protein
MNLVDLVAMPDSFDKTSSVAQSALGRILLGNKNLTKAQLREGRKYVTRSGYEKLDPNKGMIRSLLMGSGKNPLKTLGARFRQGGVLGKGGLLRGEMALNPLLSRSYLRIKRGGGTAADYKNLAVYGGGGGAMNALLVGLPAASIYSSATDPNVRAPGASVGMELGTTLGYLLGGPLGAIGSIGAGMAGGFSGGYVGSHLDGKPIQQVSDFADIPAGPYNRVSNYQESLYDPYQNRYGGPGSYTSVGLAPLPQQNAYSYELSPENGNNGLALGSY